MLLPIIPRGYLSEPRHMIEGPETPQNAGATEVSQSLPPVPPPHTGPATPIVVTGVLPNT